MKKKNNNTAPIFYIFYIFYILAITLKLFPTSTFCPVPHTQKRHAQKETKKKKITSKLYCTYISYMLYAICSMWPICK